ncbi:Glucan endo-1 3-beta-glucosidase 5 [Bienertia sinuspersici]
MISIVKFLNNNASPLVVNIYPFLSLDSDPDFPIDFAFFEGGSHPVQDGSITYKNVFEANYDTLISALEKAGFPNMPVMIGEVGWPSDGAPNANIANARKFNQGLITRILQGKGTPKRRTPPEVYIFSLIDEDAKSVDPGNFERHWGLFYYDGSIKYQLKMAKGKSLVPAKGVKYLAKKWCVLAPQANPQNPSLAQSISSACQVADCTSLSYGASCSKLDARSNASYAFNMYYQTKNQSAGACNFNNMGITTTKDPSQSGCRFEIMIDVTKTLKNGSPSLLPIRFQMVVGLILFVVASTISFAP